MEDDEDRAVECCMDVEVAIIKTLTDMRPAILKKYGLSEQDADEVFAGAVLNAGVRLEAYRAKATPQQLHMLARHVNYLCRGAAESWASYQGGQS